MISIIEIKSIEEKVLFSFECEDNTIVKTLEEAIAQDIDLSHANLKNANLDYVNLSGADLSFANLSRAIFEDANLKGAKLNYSILTNADFTNTKF
jgi:uncharacterized protein YjbI with pentapeptide repeats